MKVWIKLWSKKNPFVIGKKIECFVVGRKIECSVVCRKIKFETRRI